MSRLRRFLGIAAAVAALGVSLAAFAAASTATLKLDTTTSAALGERVAVTPQGRTLYELSGETAHHLLCRSATCTHFWPPLTVASRATKLRLGGGLHGHLTLVRRPGGALGVALGGHPLYRYSGDHARGQAAGQGIVSFGGTWHAAAVATSAPAQPVAPTSTYPPTTPAPATTTPATTPAPTPTTPTTPTTTTPYPPYPPYGY